MRAGMVWAVRLSAAMAVVAASAGFAGPNTITYQGCVLKPDGSPVAAGTYRIRFRIFDAVTAGTQRWEEIDAAVPVTGGLFAATLGDGMAFGTLFAAYPNLWLEVAVDLDKNSSFAASEVYSPRQKMSGAAWAIEADRLDGRHAGSGAGNVPLNNGALNATLNSDLLDGQHGPYYTPLKWTEVSGATIQAAANKGYVAANAARVTITLPASASLAVGDTIRVSGAGAGGWKIAQNPGQSIRLRTLEIPNPSTTWVARESNRDWYSVASSADGTKLVACVQNGQVYTSSDSGATWTGRASVQNWHSVASSADGAKLVACADGGQIYTSLDSGVNWTPRQFNGKWYSVASSADGTKLVACVSGGQIYTSPDSGVTWTAQASNRNWWSVASSADGTKLAACVMGGGVYVSPDSGINWNTYSFSLSWSSVASSADGVRLVACESGGMIYTSSDSGATWTPHGYSRFYRSVASSADGTKLVACVNSGRIYTSPDSGVTLTACESNRHWYSVASSADGTKLVACDFGAGSGGQIYTYSFTLEDTTVGTDGYLSGHRGDAVELQYVGANTFAPLSHEGSLGAN